MPVDADRPAIGIADDPKALHGTEIGLPSALEEFGTVEALRPVLVDLRPEFRQLICKSRNKGKPDIGGGARGLGRPVHHEVLVGIDQRPRPRANGTSRGGVAPFPGPDFFLAWPGSQFCLPPFQPVVRRRRAFSHGRRGLGARNLSPASFASASPSGGRGQLGPAGAHFTPLAAHSLFHLAGSHLLAELMKQVEIGQLLLRIVHPSQFGEFAQQHLTRTGDRHQQFLFACNVGWRVRGGAVVELPAHPLFDPEDVSGIFLKHALQQAGREGELC